jgi:hypothetical protein
LIGPQHILLGLLREKECEAAQMLSAHGVTLDGMWTAVAAFPVDQEAEAKIQKEEQARVPRGDNPSAGELERWIAPPITVEQETTGLPFLPLVEQPADPVQEVEAQVRRTQLVLGTVLGFTFGFWLAGWMLGSILALAGFGVATFRSSWLGIFVGVTCGLLIVPLFQSETSPALPLLFGVLGGFLGSFLGDGWRFGRILIHQPSPVQQDPDKEASHAVEDGKPKGSQEIKQSRK